MSDSSQSFSEPISEKLRLIRFRMKQERVRFFEEIRLIPRRVVVAVVVLYLATLAATVTMTLTGFIHGGEWPLSLRALAVAGLVTAASVPVACVLFLIGYVHRDAQRRGMNAMLWTMLVIVLLPAYLATGFIIYFLLRDPLPYQCPRCSTLVSARFNFCPHCKYNLQPACPQCKRDVSDGDVYCPHCGSDIHPAPAPAPQPGIIEAEGCGT